MVHRARLKAADGGVLTTGRPARRDWRRDPGPLRRPPVKGPMGGSPRPRCSPPTSVRTINDSRGSRGPGPWMQVPSDRFEPFVFDPGQIFVNERRGGFRNRRFSLPGTFSWSATAFIMGKSTNACPSAGDGVPANKLMHETRLWEGGRYAPAGGNEARWPPRCADHRSRIGGGEGLA